MKRILVTLLIPFLLLGCSNSGKWKLLGISNVAYQYADPETLDKANHIGWVKYEFKEGKELIVQNNRVTMELLKQKADCKNRQLKTLKRILYLENGKTLTSVDNKHSRSEEVIPNSLGENAQKWLCEEE